MKEIQKKLKQKESDDSTSDYSVHDESEDEVDIDPNTCYKCGGSVDNSGWIACQRCIFIGSVRT